MPKLFTFISVWTLFYLIVNYKLQSNINNFELHADQIRTTKKKVMYIYALFVITLCILACLGRLSFGEVWLMGIGMAMELLWFRKVKFSYSNAFWKVKFEVVSKENQTKTVLAAMFALFLILLDSVWMMGNIVGRIEQGLIIIVIIWVVLLMYVRKRYRDK
ncbi:MAG: hypothetical protein IJ711_05250 [Lachnospiraceae bacterium]|nr:hypothetical protein [Lachnospiraceae bacterium]